MEETTQSRAGERERGVYSEAVRGEALPAGVTEDQVPAGEASYEELTPEDLEPRPFTPPERRRVLWVVAGLVALLLLAVVPPLVNVNRYQKQIASSIGQSLGRPVRIGSVTLDVLPMPGFTLSNFVVGEDPEFGAEPVIRANEVRARLRWRSLWQGRVEFSRISLVDPSVNLVHRADGRWNVESILLQASRMPAAPTGQKGPGDRPRFPYIEATGARVNVKMSAEKMPISLTDAAFALWLPRPEQWRLRLEAHPARTDTAASETGTFRLEGTLGRAARRDEVPVDLRAEWTAAPLGAVSWVVMGRDAGFRGEMTLRASVLGTVGTNTVESRLELRRVRQADFVPDRTLDVDVRCGAKALGGFTRLEGVRCGSQGGGLEITGEVPETMHPTSAVGAAEVTGLPASTLLDGLRMASARVAPGLTLTGTLAGRMECCGAGRQAEFTVTDARLMLAAGAPLLEGEVVSGLQGEQMVLRPLALNLGGPAAATLDAHVGWDGYGMRLSGPVLRSRLLELAGALPQFGDGLEEALPAPGAGDGVERVDLSSERKWGGKQVWTAVAPAPVRKGPRRR